MVSIRLWRMMICSNLNPSKLDKINLHMLQTYMSWLKIFTRASTSKLIHDWIPTYSSFCHQGQEPSPLCPRCLSWVETCEHVRVCPDNAAIQASRKFLLAFLSSMAKIYTPIYILQIFEYKLSLVLDIPSLASYSHTLPIPPERYQTLIEATRHQNIIGWDNFLRGYTSQYWLKIYNDAHDTTTSIDPSMDWDKRLVSEAINIYKAIWDDRYYLHGNSKKEAASKLRQQICDRVILVYKQNPTQDYIIVTQK
jgi:hypothetical protein